MSDADNKDLNLKAHLFICTNTRDGSRASCGARGSSQLRDRVKKACKRFPGIRVNAAGCLGHCEAGVVAVLYPKQKWFTNLDPADPATENALIAEVEKSLGEK